MSLLNYGVLLVFVFLSNPTSTFLCGYAGFSTREDAEARLVESMTNLLNDWPRESNRGFMQHFTNRALQAQLAFPHKNRMTY